MDDILGIHLSYPIQVSRIPGINLLRIDLPAAIRQIYHLSLGKRCER
jgi:hypothetical protein